MTKLKCSDCKDVMDEELFPRNHAHKHRNGREYVCKMCKASRDVGIYSRNKTAIKKATIARRKTTGRAQHYTWESQHRRKGIPGAHTLQEWLDILKSYGYKCAYCQCDLKSLPSRLVHKDHVIPISKGGSNDIQNIVPACASCNCSKRERPLELWRSNVRP